MRKPVLLLISIFLFTVGILHAQPVYDKDQLIRFYQNQEYGKAVEYLLASSKDAAATVQYNSDLGYSFYMNEQYDEAVSLFKQVYALQPSNTLASIYLAQIYTDRKNPDSSLFFYKNLISYQPMNYRFLQKAGLVFKSQNNYDSARHYFQSAYAINPSSGSLVIQFSDVLTRLKESAKADSILRRFLAVDSSNRDVIGRWIDLCYKKADFKTAITWGEKLWQDSADVLMPYINLAYSYLAVDSIDKCISLTEWLSAQNKTTTSLAYCAAQAWSKKKNYTRSNELLDECLKESLLDEAVAYFNLKSDNYESMKQYAKAIGYYDTSYYIFHTAPDLYYAGRIYDKYLNNRAKASYYYRQFLIRRKNPRNSGEARVFDYVREYLKRTN